jgi:7-keto-8-aminopelargonate synthetase-like enzyme
MALSAPLQQIDRVFVLYRGRKLIYFGGCDYFRLSSHPKVLRALKEGAQKFGLNVAASRSTTGNHVLFEKLEEELANFFRVERAALLSNGYATNLAVTQTFASQFTHAVIDERCHGSPRDAAQLLRCPVLTFAHRDVKDFRRVLKTCGRSARPFVLTDGMFSHDGSLAPLREYLDALPRTAMLLVDDAHGAGTLGKTGRGTVEVCGVRDSRVVQTISLSKAFGVYGGAVLGSAKVITEIQEHSRIFNGNTPLPLPLANAALTSVKILKQDHRLRVRLNSNTARLKGALRSVDCGTADNDSPLVTIVPGTPRDASSLSGKLLRAGIFPSLISYSGGQCRYYFRFAVSSEHSSAQLDQLAEVLIEFLH